MVESTDAFLATLKIDTAKDVKSLGIIMASNPNSKDKVEAVQRIAPEKDCVFKDIGVIELHEQ